MSLQIILTGDGSHSIASGGRVTYHSTFGALQESRHIFIGAGLLPVLSIGAGPIAVYELGFGTGLNALLTLMEAEGSGRAISYETVEMVPLGMEIVRQLNYCERLGRPGLQPRFERLHAAPWEQEVEIVPGFTLLKVRGNGAAHRLRRLADIVYYDPFDPATQPELWDEDVFWRLIDGLAPGAVLVTYCCKAVVRRAMEAVGFTVEKLPGPSGKREILRARKPA